MAIKKIKIEIKRIDNYTIEFDDDIINKEWMENYSSYMHDVDTLEELAEAIAFQQMRFGDGFKEGFGHVTKNGKKYYPHQNEDFAPGINIIVHSEDDDFEYETEEIN
jgi:hypothetical protein